MTIHADLIWRHRELVRRLENAVVEPLEPLWADVTALQLVADVLEGAFIQHGAPCPRRRNYTNRDHADRTEAIKSYLASHLGEQISLDDVARVVYTSPFHLARIFQGHAGMPVHRYFMQLRLRASIERLNDGAVNANLLVSTAEPS